MCVDCEKFVTFTGEDGMVVGRCGCTRERVMTTGQFIEYEALENPISQTLVLAHIDCKNIFDTKGLNVGEEKDPLILLRKQMEVVVLNIFGDVSEVDAREVIKTIQRMNVVESL
jgi:hypothetical protein